MNALDLIVKGILAEANAELAARRTVTPESQHESDEVLEGLDDLREYGKADERQRSDALDGLDDLKNYGKSNAPEEPEGGDDALEGLDDLKNYGREARERRASRARERRESRHKRG